MNRRVWVLGDAVVDLVPDAQGRYLKCPGGAPANVAVGVSRLGGDSAFIGRVGADPFGRFLRHVLEHHNEREHIALAQELPLELQKAAWADEPASQVRTPGS